MCKFWTNPGGVANSCGMLGATLPGTQFAIGEALIELTDCGSKEAELTNDSAKRPTAPSADHCARYLAAKPRLGR